jgi:hypothetical protein
MRGPSAARYSRASRLSSSTPMCSLTAGASSPPAGASRETTRVGVGGVQALQHLLLGQAGLGGDLGDGGGAPDLLGQLGHHLVQRQVQLLEPPRHPDRPALVAEVALELARRWWGWRRWRTRPRGPGRSGRWPSAARWCPPGPGPPAAPRGCGTAGQVLDQGQVQARPAPRAGPGCGSRRSAGTGPWRGRGPPCGR